MSRIYMLRGALKTVTAGDWEIRRAQNVLMGRRTGLFVSVDWGPVISWGGRESVYFFLP